MRNLNSCHNKTQNNKISLTQYSNSLIKKKNKKTLIFESISRKDERFNLLKLLMNNVNDKINKKPSKRNLKQSFSNESISSFNSKPKLNINLNLENDILYNKFTKNHKKNNNNSEESLFKLEKSLNKNKTKNVHNSFLIQNGFYNQSKKKGKDNKNTLSFDNLLDVNNINNKSRFNNNNNNNTHSTNSTIKINSFRALQTNSFIGKKNKFYCNLLSNNNCSINSKGKKTIKTKHNSFVTQNVNFDKKHKINKKISISLKKRNKLQENENPQNNNGYFYNNNISQNNFNNFVFQCEKLKERTNKVLSNYLSLVENQLNNS